MSILLASLLPTVWHGLVIPFVESFTQNSPLATAIESFKDRFVHFWQGSGIHYLNPNKLHLKGLEITDNINPFDQIAENPKHFGTYFPNIVSPQ